MTPIELAWAAGFFEGEGSVRISNNSTNRTFGQLQCELSQVDPEPVEFFRSRWGGRVYMPKVHGRQRPYSRWVIYRGDAVPFLTDILPYIVRSQFRAKVVLALAFQEQKTSTHLNRSKEYRDIQKQFIAQMAALNKRGLTEVERAVMSNRLQ